MARLYLLATVQMHSVLLMRAVSVSINVVFLKRSFFHVGTSDCSVIIVIVITVVIVVTNTQGIWLNLPKCIPLQS